MGTGMTSPSPLPPLDGPRPSLSPAGSSATTVSTEDEEENARLTWSACSLDILEVSNDREGPRAIGIS